MILTGSRVKNPLTPSSGPCHPQHLPVDEKGLLATLYILLLVLEDLITEDTVPHTPPHITHTHTHGFNPLGAMSSDGH